MSDVLLCWYPKATKPSNLIFQPEAPTIKQSLSCGCWGKTQGIFPKPFRHIIWGTLLCIQIQQLLRYFSLEWRGRSSITPFGSYLIHEFLLSMHYTLWQAFECLNTVPDFTGLNTILLYKPHQEPTRWWLYKLHCECFNDLFNMKTNHSVICVWRDLDEVLTHILWTIYTQI